jgi:hypothetical protein
MKPEAFSSMLEYEAATRGEPYQWQVTVYKLRYGSKTYPSQEVEPMPPTILFMLELRALEAQAFIRETDRLTA